MSKKNSKIIAIDTDSSVDNNGKIESNSKIKTNNKKKPKTLKDSNYERPVLTYTDKLSKQEIETLLMDYEKVEDLNKVPIGTHIRYFEDKDGELKFRTGGILTIKKGLPIYCILKNQNLSWSVQVEKCIFFRRITIKEVKKEYENKLLEKDKELNELRSYIRDLRKQLKSYTAK